MLTADEKARHDAEADRRIDAALADIDADRGVSFATRIIESARARLDGDANPGTHAPEGDGGSEPRRAKVTRLDTVKPERVEWLWPGRLPRRKLVVLDGDPGTGKSTLALDLAARITTGSPMPDGARLDGPADVVVLTAEDGLADTVMPRLLAAGGDPARVHVLEHMVSRGTVEPFTIPGDLDVLESLANTTGAALVVVDVLAAYLSGKVDSYRDADVRRALHPLAALADRTGATVLALRHLSKGGGANAVYRGGGSIAIIGAARVGLMVAADPDDETRRVLAITKSNLGAIPDAFAYRLIGSDEYGCAAVAWLGATAHVAADLLVDRPGDEERGPLDEAEAFLVDLIGYNSKPAREVYAEASDAGISKRTLERAKAKRRVRSEKIGDSWHWAWPQGRQPRRESQGGEVGDLGDLDEPEPAFDESDPDRPEHRPEHRPAPAERDRARARAAEAAE